MTTKDLLRKQVIIPMNNDITKKFIKDSSSHIININQALKAIKSSTIVLWNALDTNIFLFLLLSIFLDFIFLFF